MTDSYWKAVITGAAGGLVAWWAVDRFYKLARQSSASKSLVPYCIGAGAGLAYGQLVIRGSHNPLARVPLGAAVYLAKPNETAPPQGGRDVPEKAQNFALRLAAKGLKKVAEAALLP